MSTQMFALFQWQIAVFGKAPPVHKNEIRIIPIMQKTEIYIYDEMMPKKKKLGTQNTAVHHHATIDHL